MFARRNLRITRKCKINDTLSYNMYIEIGSYTVKIMKQLYCLKYNNLVYYKSLQIVLFQYIIRNSSSHINKHLTRNLVTIILDSLVTIIAELFLFQRNCFYPHTKGNTISRFSKQKESSKMPIDCSEMKTSSHEAIFRFPRERGKCRSLGDCIS